MNEKIRELAQQASDNSDYQLECVTDQFLEEFAKLIVTEGAIVIVNHPLLSDVKSAARGAAVIIKEHFGVKK